MPYIPLVAASPLIPCPRLFLPLACPSLSPIPRFALASFSRALVQEPLFVYPPIIPYTQQFY